MSFTLLILGYPLDTPFSLSFAHFIGTATFYSLRSDREWTAWTLALGRIRIQTKNRRRNERCFSYLNQSTLPYYISSSGIFTRPNKQTPRICLCPSPPHTSHAPPVQHPRWPASVACITCLDLQVHFPTRPAPQLQHSDPIPSPSLRTRRDILPFIDMHWNLELSTP